MSLGQVFVVTCLTIVAVFIASRLLFLREPRYRCTWCGRSEIEAREQGCPQERPVCPMEELTGSCSCGFAPMERCTCT